MKILEPLKRKESLFTGAPSVEAAFERSERFLKDTVCGDGSPDRAELSSDRAHRSWCLHEEFFQLGYNVFAVRVLTKRIQMWPNFVHQHFSLCWLTYVNHFLHNIIGILILHHDVKCAEKYTNTLSPHFVNRTCT